MRKKILTLVLISISFGLNAQTEYPIKQATQKVNESPWYGLGESNIVFPDVSYNSMQLAGYYGLLLKTASGELSLQSNGNLGVGTTAPGAKLHVNGSGYIATRITGTTAADMHLEVTGSDRLIFRKDNDNARFFLLDNTGAVKQNNILVLKNDGNVGIGITDPQSELEINGSLTIDCGTFYFDRSANKEHYKICSPAWNNGLQYHHYTAHKFFTRGTERLIIKQNGRVGIGTTNPQSLLAVNGTITSTEVVVTTEGWSDFVFNKDYELKDLEEVESFIEENNHLPDVPSEKEVMENGIQLGEMDGKLLQKIEELTLYMIEMNKNVKLLQEKNSKLEEEIKILKAL